MSLYSIVVTILLLFVGAWILKVNANINHYSLYRGSLSPTRILAYPFFHLNYKHLLGNAYLVCFCSVACSFIEFSSVLLASYVFSTATILIIYPRKYSVVGASGIAWGFAIWLLCMAYSIYPNFPDSLFVIGLISSLGLILSEALNILKMTIYKAIYPQSIVHASGGIGGLIVWLIL